MPSGDKYVGLTTFLENCGQDRIELTIPEIDRMVGGLPKWVYNPGRHPWGNSTGSSLYSGWLNAGYKAKHDKDSKSVIFTKDNRGVFENTP